MKNIFKTSSRILALLFALSLGMGTAWAYSFSAVAPTGQTLYYSITNSSNRYVSVIPPNTQYNGYTKPTGNLEIPSTVVYNNVTYMVTSIGASAFYQCSGLTSVTIPNSVTSIGTFAFRDCSGLTSVTIPNSVTSIGDDVFYYCSGLTSVTIPNSVTSIGEWAFGYCSGLTSVTIPNSVTSIGSYAFRGCSGLTSVTIPNSVTSIGDDVFYYCSGLTSVTIPNSVTSIGYHAFNGCSGLTSVTIPNSVTSIGDYAFYGCSGLTSVTIPNSVTSIGNNAFGGCSGLTSLTVNCTTPPSLGTDAFAGMSTYLLVTVPCESLAAYQAAQGWNAFTNYYDGCSPIVFADDNVKALCVATATGWDSNGDGELSYDEAAAVTSLESVFAFDDQITSFDELQYFTGLTSLGDYEFAYCSNLSSVALPASITSIGDGAFQDCSSLTSIYSHAPTPPDLGTDAFSGVPNGATVYVPCSRLALYQSTSGWNNFTNYVEFDAGFICFADPNVKALCVANWDSNGDGELSYAEAATVTNLGEVFRGTTTITSFDELQYFTGLTSIGNYAFYNCSGLTSVTIPNSVTRIGNYAFHGCSGLTSVTIPNSVTSIGNNAFNGCSGLTSVTIPNSVTSIGNNAFYSCSGLTSVTIPNSVTSIGSYAFHYCIGLTSVTIPNSVTSIGSYAFWGCSGLTSVIIPNSVTSIGSYAFSYCSGLTSVTIPNSVTSIGSNVFRFCSGLTSVTIPNSVTSIGNNAFYYCSGLTSLTVNCTTPPSLGTDAFAGIPRNIPVYVPCGTASAYQSASGWNEFPVYEEMATDDCIIDFSDANVKTICVANWDTNSDGELSYGEAAAVSDLGINFKSKTSITSFDELQYFTGLTSISNQAFMGCSALASISLPEGVGSVGNGSFFNCSALSSISVYAENPPTFGNNPFANVPTNAVLFVPCGASATYRAHSGWSRFATVVEMCDPCRFVVSGNWNDASNWLSSVMPETNGNVSIESDCHINTNVTVANLTITEGGALDINADAKLTVTEVLANDGGSANNLVIAFGGQLVHFTDGLHAKLYRSVTPYTEGENDGWHLIASSLASEIDVSDVTNLTNRDYDLYYYDEPTHYWMNEKEDANGFDVLEPNQGYLYASATSTEPIIFTGEVKNGSATVSIPLSYTEGIPLKGFNLVGNPFVHNVTSYASQNVANGCYVMNEVGDDLMVSEINENHPLKPTEGFFVKATGANASITFNPGRGTMAGRSGSVNMEVADEGKLLDRLIVKPTDGEPLEKMSLNEERTRIYATHNRQDVSIVPCEGNEQTVNFKAAKRGTYTIAVNVEGMETTYLHLIDNLTGNDIDLLQTPTYTFEAKPTDYAARFRLVFNANDDNGTSAETETFAFYNGSAWAISNEGEATLQVIDALGRVLSSETISGNAEVNIDATPGVYVMRLVNGDSVKTQKVVVK